MGKLYVACVYTGQKYTTDYVLKLQSMVARNLGHKHQFVCFTDSKAFYNNPDIITIDAPIKIADSWAKIGLFKHNPFFQEGDKILYLDLDVVIINNMHNLIVGKRGFWIIKDWVRDSYNSSVMYWDYGCEQANKIWENYSSLAIQQYRGDQDLITALLPNLKTFNEDLVLSYKFSGMPQRKPEKGIVWCFHGKPKNHELLHLDWVKQAWQ